MPSEVSWNRLRQHPLPVGSVVGVRLALYFRISTADQNSELQQRDLRADASSRGEIVETYQDVASGSTNARPDLTRLIADAKAGKFDCVLVWKLDRFGRSLVDCLNNIRTLDENSIRLIAVTQGLDTDSKNPGSRFLLHVLAAAAEFERELIR
jgi:DNA invertase Pin-like site-specific DNA recombinase